MAKLGMVHCYGDRKPWNKDVPQSQLNSLIATAHSRWAYVVKSLGSPLAKLGHTLPLSAAGARRYLQDGFAYAYFEEQNGGGGGGGQSEEPSSAPTVHDPCDGFQFCSERSVCVPVDVDGTLTATCECKSGYEEIDRVCVDINGTFP